MFQYLANLIDETSLSPHGICLLWRPELIWTHAVSDALIGLAYLSIPIVLATFVIRRRDIAFSWVFWCFAFFIVACGATHFLSIWTLWVPDYGLEAIVKAGTAGISVVTAAALWPLLPRALALPSPTQLHHANAALRERIVERDEALLRVETVSAERQRAEEMLRHSQKMEAIGQLTGGVAHDFNNLLGVIVANLERLERLQPSDSPAMKPVRNAMEGAERAAKLISSLLAFGRRQSLTPQPVDTTELVQSASELLRTALGSGIALVTDLAPHPWPARVDPDELGNALLNLALNARDAIKEGGTLTMRTRNVDAWAAAKIEGLARRDYVLIEIADTGMGMPPDILDRAFEPFFTTKPFGQGTGLGLSRVFGFAKQSGGTATLESTPGVGTIVRLYLPRATQADAAVPGASIAAAGPAMLPAGAD